MNVEQRLSEMGIVLQGPAPNDKPYGPYVKSGRHIFVSGHGPDHGGRKWRGGVGSKYTVDEGYEAARACALNLLGTLQKATGHLDCVRIVKVTGFVQAPPGFSGHPSVVNGCSDLLRELFGVQHARSAIGVASLPNDWPIEIELIAEIMEDDTQRGVIE